MTTTTAPAFIEVATTKYPYRTLHEANCKTALRAHDYNRDVLTLEMAAEKEDNRYSRWNRHAACIRGEVWMTLMRRAEEVKQSRIADERLTARLESIAITTVALEKMTAAVGDLTTEATARLDEYIEGVRSGSFTPRLRDNIAAVAFSREEA